MVVTLEEQRSLTNADLVSQTGKGVVVAVLDTGMQSEHEMLAGKVLLEKDYTGSGARDINGHGTSVASTISNMAVDAKLFNMKVLRDGGTGSFDWVLQATEDAVDAGATIINMSLGGGIDCLEDGVVAKFFDDMLKLDNVMFVASAGNRGPGQNPGIPALSRSVLAVGSLQKDMSVSFFSSRGPSCNRVYPDCVSFGSGLQVARLGGGIRIMSGTSFSAPMVSGMLALAQEKAGIFSRQKLEALLEVSCNRLNGSNKSNDWGWGFLDASKLDLAITDPVIPPVTPNGTSSSVLPAVLIGGAFLGGMFLLSNKTKR